MKLYLKGHTELYAVEQLQMQLFPEEPTETVTAPFGSSDGAVSALSHGKKWLTATCRIVWKGKKTLSTRRIPVEQADDVRLRRRILQQTYFLAATEILGTTPPWGALSGVRPTKLSTQHMQAGGTEASADRMLRDVYFVSGGSCVWTARSTRWRRQICCGKRICLYISAFPSAPPAAPTAPSSASPSRSSANFWSPIWRRC